MKLDHNSQKQSSSVDLLTTKIPLTSAITALGVVISFMISYGSSYVTEKGIDKAVTVQMQTQNAVTEKRLDYNQKLREALEDRTKALEVDGGKTTVLISMIQKDLEDVKKDSSDTKKMVWELLTAKRMEDAKRGKHGTAVNTTLESFLDSQTHQ